MPSLTAAVRFRLPLAVLPIAAALAGAPAAHADVTCTRFASPTGSDSATGTQDAPFRTAQKLVDSLGAGDTGCLRGGTYAEDVRMDNGGASGAPLTLTSYPGERARVVGRFYIPKGSDFVTVANLDLDGTPALGTNASDLPSPTVNARHATFADDDVTNEHHEICFLLGSGWGDANDFVLQHNRIHDCGKLPSQNQDHGIYVELATDGQVLDNVISDNADRGVQLYPNAQNTRIAGNVIDGNGEGIIFSGDGGISSNGNVVEDNIITNSNIRNNVESWYPSGTPAGQGNLVSNNCIAGGAQDDGDGGIGPQVGFTLGIGNVIGKDPLFVDRAAKDFRLAPDSPCAGIANGATGSTAQRVVVNPTTTTTSTATTTTTTTTSTSPFAPPARAARAR